MNLRSLNKIWGAWEQWNRKKQVSVAHIPSPTDNVLGINSRFHVDACTHIQTHTHTYTFNEVSCVLHSSPLGEVFCNYRCYTEMRNDYHWGFSTGSGVHNLEVPRSPPSPFGGCPAEGVGPGWGADLQAFP